MINIVTLAKLPGVYKVEYNPLDIKSKYKKFYDLKEGDYIYIANRYLNNIFFLKIEKIKQHNTEEIILYWPSKQNLKGKYGSGDKFSTHHIFNPKKISHIQDYDWYNVDYNTKYYACDSYICTTLEEAMHLISLDDYDKQKSIKFEILININ